MEETIDPRAALVGQGYHLVDHAAVKPCLWLNRSLRGGDQCYKHHFYGISSHRCIQMTPALHCNHLCLHCWRPVDQPIDLPQSWLEPEELLDRAILEQRRFLSGYGGSPVLDRQRFLESKDPAHLALSLIGEPTFYPQLGDLIEAARRRRMTTFLVSNGTSPQVLERVRPTQLYLSLNAPHRELYLRAARPSRDDWDQVLQSLDLLGDHPSRTVVRITLVKGVNMDPAGFSRLLKHAHPDFIEAKAYMHLGKSRGRLTREAMPAHEEVMIFARDLAEDLGYSLAGEVPLSRVALLSSNRRSRFIEGH